MKYLAVREKEAIALDLEEQEQGVKVDIAGETMRFDLTPFGENRFSLLVDGRSYTATVLEVDERYVVQINGKDYAFEVDEEEIARLRSQVKSKRGPGREQIKAPMPGRIVSIAVQTGDTIRRGQSLLVIEAMKMENDLRAPVDGRVKEIRVNVGDAANKNDTLMLLEGIEEG